MSFFLSSIILNKTWDLNIRDVLIMSKGLGILTVVSKMFSIAEGKGRAMSRRLFGFIHPRGAAAVTLARGHRVTGGRDTVVHRRFRRLNLSTDAVFKSAVIHIAVH